MGLRLWTRNELRTWYVPRIDTEHEYKPGVDEREPAELPKANTLSSIIETDHPGDSHALVLDIDVPAVLVPSSTPGHSHLIVDVCMSWPQYQAVLQTLSDAGVIQPGYADASIERGATFIRLPWVRKPPPEGDEAPF